MSHPYEESTPGSRNEPGSTGDAQTWVDPTFASSPPAVDPYSSTPVTSYQPPAPYQAPPPYQPPAPYQPTPYQAPTYQAPTYQAPTYDAAPAYEPPSSGAPSYPPPSSGGPSYGTPSYGQPNPTAPLPPSQAYQAYQPKVQFQPTYGANPMYPGGIMPPPKRTGRTVGIVVGIVALVVILCVAGVVVAVMNTKTTSDTSTNGSGPLPTTGVGASSSPTLPVTHTHTADLRTYLLKPPSSSNPLQDPLSKNGLLTLKQDAALSDHPTARTEFLERYGFKREAVTGWHAADDTIVDLRILQFASAEMATEYLAEDLTNFQDDSGTSHTVPGMTGARTFVDTKKDKYGYQQTVSLGSRGDVVIVMFTSQLPPVSLTVANKLLTQEYDKL